MGVATTLIVFSILHVQHRLLLQQNFFFSLLPLLLSLGQVLLQIGCIVILGTRDCFLVSILGPWSKIAVNVTCIVILLFLPFVQRSFPEVFKDSLVLHISCRGLRANQLVSFTLLSSTRVVGKPITVKSSPLSLKLKLIDMSVLNQASQSVLVSCLLLGLERICRARNWCVQLVIPGIVLHFSGRRIEMPPGVEGCIELDHRGGHNCIS